MQPLLGLLNKTTHQLCVNNSSIIFTTIVRQRWSSKVMQYQQTFFNVQNGRLIDSSSLIEYIGRAQARVIDLLFDKQLVRSALNDAQLALYWCMLETDAIIDGRVLLQYILLMNSLDIEIRSITITNAK